MFKIEYILIVVGLALAYLNLSGCAVKLVKPPTELSAQYEQN